MAALLVYVVLTRGIHRYIAVAVVVLTMTVLYIWEYLYPELVISYTDAQTKLYDLFLTAIMCVGLIAFIASYIMRNYHDEREMVIKQRDKILAQNEEIKKADRALLHHKENLEKIVKERTQELEKTNLELQIAKNKAEESDRLKTAFLSNMSHEIRTPMNAIIGFSNLLKDPNITPENLNNYTDIITERGNQLLNIINDIIDIAKIESGKIHIQKSACSVNKLFNELYTTFYNSTELAKKSHLEFRAVKPDIFEDPIINTDTSRLKQILSNLIKNAIKFTQTGFVEMGYSVLEMEESKKIQFYVKDSGIGISKENLTIIFNQFRQIDESHTRLFGGAGIGLSISKNLAKLLGGDLLVTSEQGKGSTFFLTLPYETVKIAKTPTEVKKLDEKDINWKDKTILITEDNPSSFLLLKSMLNKTKANILHSGNGQEAVDLCKSNPHIHAVLMDIQLPVMNGYDATRKIKETRNDLPVIAQTAHALVEDEIKSKDAGCDDYLVKPIRRELLFATLSKYLD
jgi:signal transduction histidine kinase